MSVTSICTDIQTENATIAGIESAPDDWPGALNTAALPIALTRPGACDWPDTALGDNQATRVFISEFYVKPLPQGLFPADAMTLAKTLLQAVGAAWVTARDTFSDDVEEVESIHDDGIQVLNYSGTDYLGFVFTFRIREA